MKNQSNTEKFSTRGMVIGILMVVVSLFTQGTMSNVEEILLSKYEIDVQRMVGLEGLFGMVWIFIWMMVFSFIPCPDSQLCDVSCRKLLLKVRWEDTWKTQ